MRQSEQGLQLGLIVASSYFVSYLIPDYFFCSPTALFLSAAVQRLLLEKLSGCTGAHVTLQDLSQLAEWLHWCSS